MPPTQQPDTLSPFVKPFTMMAKAAGARCNLACRYCYYLDKEQLYPGQACQMSEPLLRQFISEYIATQQTQDVWFIWHGGEPLLRRLDFYRQAVLLQREYAGSHIIHNALQTNGTLLDDDWCRFLADEGWLVGISIDGTAEWHDAYRRQRGGQPTHALVMQGIERLKRHGVDWNAMAVVNRINADHPREFYQFFKDIGCQYLQFTPIVEPAMPELSVTPEQWGTFCCELYDAWAEANDIGRIFVQLFDATLANWVGIEPGVCTLAETCGCSPVMEWNGDVYCCDHFVSDAYRLGNVHQQSLLSLVSSPQQVSFGLSKRTSLPRQCRECQWLPVCHGECPKNRFVATTDGEPGLNYLCKGYRQFFAHVAADMEQLAAEITQNNL